MNDELEVTELNETFDDLMTWEGKCSLPYRDCPNEFRCACARVCVRVCVCVCVCVRTCA